MTKYNASKQKDVTIYKVDLEEQTHLAKRFNVRAFPVLIYFKDSQVMHKEFGFKSVDELKSNVKKYLN